MTTADMNRFVSLSELDWNVDGIVSELREFARRGPGGSPADGQAGQAALAQSSGQHRGKPEHRPVSKSSGVADVGQRGPGLFSSVIRSTCRCANWSTRSFGNCNSISEQALPDDEHREHAIAIVREFAGHLPRIRALLESDITRRTKEIPPRRSVDQVLACYPGITAITHYRLAHALHDLVLRSLRESPPRLHTP